MNEYQELVHRIAILERRLDNVPSGDRGWEFVRADKDGDGDFDPLTSASWDGDSFSTGTGTINWNSVFGVPSYAKAVELRAQARDSGSAAAANCYVWIAAKSTTSQPALLLRLEGVANDKPRNAGQIVPVASDGTSYYSLVASGASTLDVWINVVGWYV
jgi:hypothetical protein